MAEENAMDTGLTAKEEIERVMKGSLDRIVSEWFTRRHETGAIFGFLREIKKLCYGTDDCCD